MTKTVVLTGASGLVGRALSNKILGMTDYRLIACCSRKSSKKQIEEDFRDYIKAGRLFVAMADFRQESAPMKLAAAIQRKGWKPDILINNARTLDSLAIPANGIVASKNLFLEYQMAVVVPYQLTMQFVQQKAGRLSSVINISSMYGVVAPNMGLYADPAKESPLQYGVAKAAEIHLSKELAVRLAPKGVRVNAVSYGGIEGRAGAAFQEKYAKLCPQGRMLKAEDLFGPIEFLMGNASSGMTGHNLVVDGGWSVW